MNRKTFNIIIIVLISILLGGCTPVGVVNLPINFDKDEQYTKIDPPVSNEVEENLEKENNKKDVNNEGIDNESTNNKDASNNKTTDEKDSSKTEDIDNKSTIVPKVHYYGDESKKQVALTFDDGPESKYTTQILEILNEYDIKATFFVIGQNAEKHPEMLKKIHEEGHEIGSHSWSHKNLPKVSVEEMDKQVLLTEEMLKDVIGEVSYIIRPPYGSVKSRELKHMNSLGYNVVNWSVDTKDWAGTSKKQMMSYLKQQVTPGGIILMHNTGNSKNTVEFLPEAIEWITEQGYEFGTVSEVL